VALSFPLVDVTDAEDPRLADYRALKERHLNEEGGRFIAEGERVVRRLLTSNLRVHSVFLTPARVEPLADALALRPGTPVYRAPAPVFDKIAGFPVHRGCLAVGERPRPTTLPAHARTVVVLEDLVDVDNLGAMARNASALGADALVLSPRAADPFYRKAIRVAVGAVFSLPVLRLQRWPDDLVALARGHELALVGAVLRPGAVPLTRFVRPPGVALLLGSEGPGLSEAAIAACDHLVTIPMAGGADSLNVAAAGAVILHHLQQPGLHG